MTLESELKIFCEELTVKFAIHPNKIVFNSGKTSAEKTASFFIQVFEQEYPAERSSKGTYSTIVRISAKIPTEIYTTSQEFMEYAKDFCRFNNIGAKEVFGKAKKDFQYGVFKFLDTDRTYFSFIEMATKFALDNYLSTATKFGCCDKYKKCSSVKKCVHSNILYATVCQYRKHLEKGEIFYSSESYNLTSS